MVRERSGFYFVNNVDSVGGNLGAAVHRHSLDRLNAINDSLN